MNLVIYAIPFFMLASGSERVVPGVFDRPQPVPNSEAVS